MATTSIEWTRGADGAEGMAWNVLRGCSKVSAGCQHCYAESMAARFSGPGMPFEGTIRNGKWSGEIRVVHEKLGDPLRWRKPRRVFVNSVSDVFHENVSNEIIAAIFGVMAAAQRHTFQLLTKRPERAVEWFRWIERNRGAGLPFAGDSSIPNTWLGVVESERPTWNVRSFAEPLLGERLSIRDNTNPGHAITWPLPNVHLLASCENQATADGRIPHLLACPAAVRGVSLEPLLGPVNLVSVCRNVNALAGVAQLSSDTDDICECTALDWVIVGCESGRNRRSCNLDWVCSIVDQCREEGVPVFVKQLEINGAVTSDVEEFPEWARVRMFPGDKY